MAEEARKEETRMFLKPAGRHDRATAEEGGASGNGEPNPDYNYPVGDVVMDSPTVVCIDDRPQALELRKASLKSHGYCVGSSPDKRYYLAWIIHEEQQHALKTWPNAGFRLGLARGFPILCHFREVPET
jgi:hypothetical protein